MAGMYLHIPFCKKACYYCDFYFSTSLQYKAEMLQAMKTEIALQKDFLQGETIDTVYFGGGTPSVLEAAEIDSLIGQISKYHSLSPAAEITAEANPDDLHRQKVNELRQTPVNRFSIGIQSFFEEDLVWMNRAHNAAEAESAVMRVQDAGFENITIDLIYGYPLLTDQKWKANIGRAIQLAVPHISSYAMTVEPGTALASFIRKGKHGQMDEQQSAGQFQLLMQLLQDAGFEHYEISNFALPGRYSRHNSNYWKGVPYIGIGPSAHSFNGTERQWNIANNSRYLQALNNKTIPAETELLSTADRLNEYIMTSLRTMWGMDLKKIALLFNADYLQEIKAGLPEFLEKNWVKENEHSVITLTPEGKLFADHIAASLFVSGN